jgi:CheY-like chemotaxis protein
MTARWAGQRLRHSPEAHIISKSTERPSAPRPHLALARIRDRQPRAPRVLIADVTEAVTVLSAALGNDIEVMAASEVDDALRQARRGADLVITGIHFADSQMLDLVRAIKADPRIGALPVVCVRLIGPGRPPTHLAHLPRVLEALGTVEYVDLAGLIESLGREPALCEFVDRIRVRLDAGRPHRQ